MRFIIILFFLSITLQLSAFDNYISEGNKFLKRQDYKAALLSYSRASRGCSELDKSLNNMAIAYSLIGRTKLAVLKIEDAVSVNPLNANSHYNKGLIHLLREEYQLAEYSIKEARKLGLDNEELKFNLLISQFYQRKYDQIVDEWNPEEFQSRGGQVHYMIGLSEFKLLNYKRAKKLLLQSVKSGFKEAYYQLGLLFAELGFTQEAINNIEKYLSYDESIEAQNTLGNLYLKNNRQSEARKAFESSLSVSRKNPFAYSGLMRACKEMECDKEAMRYCNKALAMDSTNAQALIFKAERFISMGNYQKAIVIFDYAAPYAQHLPEYVFAKAYAHYKIGEPRIAISQLQTIPISKNSQQKHSSAILFAKCSNQLGNYDESVRHLIDMQDSISHTEEYKKILSESFFMGRRYSELLQYVDVAASDSYEPYLYAGNASLKQRNHYKAEKYLIKADSINPYNKNIKNGLAMSKVHIGHEELARSIIDTLSHSYGQDFRIQNSKGLIYLHIATLQKERRDKENNKNFTAADSIFCIARNLNPSYRYAFDNNIALVHYYQDSIETAQIEFQQCNTVASLNNAALIDVHNKMYRVGHKKLSDLDEFFKLRQDTIYYLEDNSDLAERNVPICDEYVFIANYLLDQDSTRIDYSNNYNTYHYFDSIEDFEFLDNPIIETSDVKCQAIKIKEQVRTKLKSKNRKSYSFSSCPKF